MPVWELNGLHLECRPSLPDHIAQPWDAADEWLASSGSADLIINDRYGALQCTFPAASVWADSASAALAASQNLHANQLHQQGRVFWHEDDIPADAGQVLIKVPKTFELLQFWLQQCQQRLAPDTRYRLAGMVKHWPVSWLNWLEDQAETYQQSPVRKKARMVELTFSRPITGLQLWRGYSGPHQQRFEALPGVFARDQFDIGSRVLLDLPDPGYAGTVCDLGCGNGLLGLSLAKQFQSDQLILTDDSFLAVRSARHNAERLNIPADIRHGDCLSAVQEKLDWVVCNPPFHDGHRQLTNIAERMFRESYRQLKSGGQLLIVANRHMPYLPLLKATWKEVDSLGNDPKFSVYLCRKE